MFTFFYFEILLGFIICRVCEYCRVLRYSAEFEYRAECRLTPIRVRICQYNSNVLEDVRFTIMCIGDIVAPKRHISTDTLGIPVMTVSVLCPAHEMLTQPIPDTQLRYWYACCPVPNKIF